MVLALFACSAIAKAEGSIDFEDADRFMREQSVLRSVLLNTLCISSTGLATRVSGEYPMGGARIGPYELSAKPKGQAGPYTFRLVVDTFQWFYNKRGKATDITKAVRVKESLSHIALSELREPEPYWRSINCEE